MGSGSQPNEDSLSTVHRLRALTVELHLLGVEFGRGQGLHPTDIRALIYLVDAARGGRQATPSWLGQQLHLNSASVTALIDRMEKAGHVRRQRDSQDRRRVLLEVTPEAVELGWSFFGPVIANALAAIDAYSPQEMETVVKFLTDMQRAVEDTRPAETK
jgi:DNA-binding MarR family transcriptional regulator